jgi:hypothetical protein
MIPGQNTILINAFREKISTFMATATKKPVKEDTVTEESTIEAIKSEPSSRSQSASSKRKTVSIMPDGKEDEEIITSSHTGTVFYILEKDTELDWILQRASEWNKFKDSKQDSKKNRKFNTFWYNTKRSKDKNRSAAYSVLVSGAIASASFERDFFEKGNEIMEKLASKNVNPASANHSGINADLLICGRRLTHILRRRIAESFEYWAKSGKDAINNSMLDLRKEITMDVMQQIETRKDRAAIIEREIYERRSGKNFMDSSLVI